jgi:hypothetical protein
VTIIYVNHVREGLAELASEELQRKLWLPSEDPRIGSFEEAVEQTYTDSGLGDALDKGLAVEALGSEAVALLQQLDRALRSVDTARDVADLIMSPAMQDVRRLALAAGNAIEGAEPAPGEGASVTS